MRERLVTYITRIVVGTLVCLGLFIVWPPRVVAAGNACCVYMVENPAKAPAWLKALNDKSMYFEDGKVGQKCKQPSGVVVLATKKLDQYYHVAEDGQPEGEPLPKVCEETAYYKSFAAQVSKTSCCEVTNDAGMLRGCAPVNKKDAELSEIAASCLIAAHKTFMPGDKIIAHDQDCSAVASCQALQKKIDDIKSGNVEADGAVAAQQKQAKIAETGAKKPWTKQECVGVKNKDGEQAYNWLPPTKDPTTQIGDHCYIKPLKTNLQIHIGDNYVIEGINNYINIAYKYALGIGVVVMILTIMVSGIQWMTSGIANSINDAKQRIQNAALGLLLLFGANILLYTINPQLTQMRLPLMNAIRPESFDTPKDAGKRCDPGEKNSCAKYGAQYKCKPTEYYASKKCVQQFHGLMAITFGSAALAASGPFLIPVGGTASVVQTTGSVVLREVASTVVQEGLEMAVDYATKSSAGTAGGTAVDAATAGGKTASQAGKAAKIGKGALAVAGAVLAAAVIAENWPEDASNPADGYCIIPKPDKPSFSVCEFDGECQSGKCLLTSKSACGAGDYGVCTSGSLREACLIEKTYSYMFVDVISNKDIAAKYACKQGSCVDNSRGATKNGIGICSDGGDIGMPCGSGEPKNVECKNLGNNKELVCIAGYCREKEFFSTGTTGLWAKASVNGPRCMMATDCNDASITKLNQTQSTIMVGCLKNPSQELNLPARLLISQTNQPINQSFFKEITTYGRCVIDRPQWNNPDGTKMAFGCFANIYSSSSYATAEKAFAGYLQSKSISLGAAYANGFDIRRVGCGCEKGNKFGVGNNNCTKDHGVCVVPIEALKQAASVFANNSFISVNGVCESSGATHLSVTNKSSKEYVNVVLGDDYMNGIRFPNIIDLQYTFAGEAKGAAVLGAGGK